MRTLLTLTALASLILWVGPAASEGSSDQTLAQDKAPAAKRFSISASRLKVQRGATGTAFVKVKVAKGWKWNKQYPAKLKFGAIPGFVRLNKNLFSQKKGDFKSSDKKAAVAVKVTGTATGAKRLKAKLSFSVCNDSTCVIEHQTVHLAVEVLDRTTK